LASSAADDDDDDDDNDDCGPAATTTAHGGSRDFIPHLYGRCVSHGIFGLVLCRKVLLWQPWVDPLGYQSTSRYKKFVAEEDEITKNTRWTKGIL
jgi:hypothetical protein